MRRIIEDLIEIKVVFYFLVLEMMDVFIRVFGTILNIETSELTVKLEHIATIGLNI